MDYHCLDPGGVGEGIRVFDLVIVGGVGEGVRVFDLVNVGGVGEEIRVKGSSTSSSLTTVSGFPVLAI